MNFSGVSIDIGIGVSDNIGIRVSDNIGIGVSDDIGIGVSDFTPILSICFYSCFIKMTSRERTEISRKLKFSKTYIYVFANIDI